MEKGELNNCCATLSKRMCYFEVEYSIETSLECVSNSIHSTKDCPLGEL